MPLGNGVMTNRTNAAAKHRPVDEAWHCGEHKRRQFPHALRSDGIGWVVVLDGFAAASDGSAGGSTRSDAQLTAHGSAAAITREFYALQFTPLSKRAVGGNS